jgi:hypothetical protein
MTLREKKGGAWDTLQRSETEKNLNGVQVVGGSNPLAPTSKTKGLRRKSKPFFFSG